MPWPTSSPAAAWCSASGRGYHTREVETFGAPLLDQEANRELFEEQIDIIFKAFNEESFSHKGKHYTLPPEVPYRGYTLKELTLVPRPFRLPVECWQPIQGGSPRALEFMAKHGIQGMVGGGSAEGGAMHNVVLAWQAAHAKLGKEIELGERLCFGFHFYMANSREQGIKEAAKYYEENMKMFGELRLVRAITEEQIEIMRDPKRAPTAKLPRIEDAVAAGGFLCGNADDLIGHIKALEKKISGARPRLGQPVGRRAREGRPGAARALRQGGDAGIQGRQVGGGEVVAARAGPCRRHVFDMTPQPRRAEGARLRRDRDTRQTTRFFVYEERGVRGVPRRVEDTPPHDERVVGRQPCSRSELHPNSDSLSDAPGQS